MSEESMIYTGDCLEMLEEMEDGSAAHCMMDPPYSDHVHAKSIRSNTRTSKAKRKVKTAPSIRDLGFSSLTPALQRDVSCEVARVTRRWVLVFCNVEIVSTWIFALQGAGLDYVRTMPWVKPNSAPQFTGDRPAAGWECIVVAHRKGAKRWNSGGKRGEYRIPIEHQDRVHKTEKPLALMLEIVRDFTEPDELVIDPFSGGGSTGVACLRLGRRFAGAEMDPAMAAIANERLLAEQCDSTLRDRQAGQLPLVGGAA